MVVCAAQLDSMAHLQAHLGAPNPSAPTTPYVTHHCVISAKYEYPPGGNSLNSQY